MEVIKKQVCETSYIGNCPVCGTKQSSSWKNSVDVKCATCFNKEYTKKVKDDLLGAEVVDVSCESGCVNTIILSKPGKSEEIIIEVENHYEDPPELTYIISALGKSDINE